MKSSEKIFRDVNGRLKLPGSNISSHFLSAVIELLLSVRQIGQETLRLRSAMKLPSRVFEIGGYVPNPEPMMTEEKFGLERDTERIEPKVMGETDNCFAGGLRRGIMTIR